MTVRVSVVVPTYKRPELLGRCLAALLQQNFDPAAYEIIVVDDAACLETQRLVESWRPSNGAGRPVEHATEALLQPVFSAAAVMAGSYEADNHSRSALWQQKLPRSNGTAKKPPSLGANGGPARPRLRYTATTGACGPATARNRGWQLARGEIIAFTDDDCIPQPDWLRAGLAAFNDEAVLGATGHVLVPLPPAPTDYELDAAGLGRARFATANCFYRRRALASVGGFDERFRCAWREDSDLFFSLLEKSGEGDIGLSLKRVPRAVVVHPVRPAPWGVSLKQQRKSMFNALLYKKHPRLYRQRIQPWPPWHYYIGVLALLAVVAGLFISSVPVSLAAGFVWLGVTCGFCLRRLRGTAHSPAHIAEIVVTSSLIPPLAVFWRLVGALKFRVLFL